MTLTNSWSMLNKLHHFHHAPDHIQEHVMPISKETKPSGFSCPSSKCESGATLIGIVGENGKVGHLASPLIVDDNFVEKTSPENNQGVPAERRFRFSSPCAENKCGQWTGNACGVIGRVMTHLEEAKIPLNAKLPPCTIRSSCRWYNQRQEKACMACSFVVTDNRETNQECTIS